MPAIVEAVRRGQIPQSRLDEDPRLRTMGYGRRFLASLPPALATTASRASSHSRVSCGSATTERRHVEAVWRELRDAAAAATPTGPSTPPRG